MADSSGDILIVGAGFAGPDGWTGSMLTHRVARLDVKSGQYTEYMLPPPDQHPPRLRR